MQHEEQQKRLQKHLKGKRLGVQINEDDFYIQQVQATITPVALKLPYRARCALSPAIYLNK